MKGFLKLFFTTAKIASFVIFMAVVISCNGWAEWPVAGKGYILTSAVADINGDGNVEIIVGTQNGIYCLTKNGRIIWSYKGNNWVKPGGIIVVADLNGDGKREILAGANTKHVSDGLYYYHIYCINRHGRLMWKYEAPGWSESAHTVADVNGDGKLEIIMSSYDKRPDASHDILYCIDKDGKLMWKDAFDDVGNYKEYSTSAAADLDGDKALEILIGIYIANINTQGQAANRGWYLYCIDKAGKVRWRCDTAPRTTSKYFPTIADLNKDGALEVLVTSYDTVKCVDKNGGLLWSYNCPPEELFLEEGQAVADLDGDGNLEVIVKSSTKEGQYLYCIGKDGQLKWKNKISPAGEPRPSYLPNIPTAPIVTDLDGKGGPEILVGLGKDFACFNNAGQLIWKYNVGSFITSTPAIADLDGDGKLEVLFGAEDKKLYCLNKDGQAFVPSGSGGPIDLMPWPMFHRDVQRTGLYIPDYAAPTKPIVTDEGKYTTKEGQLYASWTCEDKESGISEYRYKITQDGINGRRVRDWTSTGTLNYVTAGALNLIEDRTYYFAVKAKNGAGLWSAIGYSDGITVDTAPPNGFIKILKYNPKKRSVTLWLFAYDKGSGMGEGSQMCFSEDGKVWSTPEPYAHKKIWTTPTGGRKKTIFAKFKDAAGNWSRAVADTNHWGYGI